MSGTLLLLDADMPAAAVKYTFDTAQANANGYVSEVGGKALSVWSGAANTNATAGKLQSNTTALMRARCNPGLAPTLWRAEFTTGASVASLEFYLDFRDNGTNRISAAAENAGNRFYLFDSYTASLITQTGITLAPSTTYTIIATEVGGLVTVQFVGGAWNVTLGPNTVSGAGATQGGVTTSGQIVAVDNLEAAA